MKQFSVLCLVSLFSIFLCSSCSNQEPAAIPAATTATESNAVSIAAYGDLEQLHLRDNPLLYEMYDPLEVVTMYLTVSRGNSGENTDHSWAEINTYSVYDYENMGVDRYQVEGLLQIGDETGPLPGEVGYQQLSPNCTVQIRGQTSSSLPQKNYKISLKDNKGTWRGQSTIALNKHQSDGLRFRNKLAYDLMKDKDELMSLRTTFVHLYVKDTTSGSTQFVDYGLYTQVEQLNKTALKAHGLDKNGHLYKIEFFEFLRYEDAIRLKSDPEYDLDAFEAHLEVKGDDDHEKLIRMLEDLNNYAIPMETILDQYFDLENLAYWMAFHLLIGNADTQSRNAYLYSPLNSDKWYLLSWDNDGMLKRTEYAIHGRQDHAGWERGVSNYWGNILFQRALKTSLFRDALDDAINDLMPFLSYDRIHTLAASYSALVKPYLYRMPDIQYAPLTEDEYNYVTGQLYEEVKLNYQFYQESYLKPMPFYIGVPYQNNDHLEIMWDPAYDFNSETITYSFELATDSAFQNILVRQDQLLLPSVTLDLLPEGQYFIRVIATNESGYSQYAFDYYVTENGKIYGTKCFYVDALGNIVEDIYVEG